MNNDNTSGTESLTGSAPVRDRLIRILDEESITDERANFLALAMVRELRWYTCKNWGSPDAWTGKGNPVKQCRPMITSGLHLISSVRFGRRSK